MQDTNQMNFKFPPAASLILICASLVIWARLYLNVHMDIDIAWLMQCLERFLHGGTYTQDFYETNPPLSFLIYLPAYPLHKFMGLSAHLSVFLCSALYSIISVYFAYKLLLQAKYGWDIIIPTIAGFLIVHAWTVGISYGLKDHLIFVFLFPFCILQTLLTYGKDVKSTNGIIVALIGSIALAIKPYYVLIPAVFLAHRLYKNKSLKSVLSAPDFYIPIISAITYLSFIYVYTPDFFKIMSEVTTIYNQDKPFPLTYRAHYILYPILALGASFLIPRQEQFQALRCLLYVTIALSFLCIIPYAMQNKGFHYHTLPFLCFGMLSLFLSVYILAYHTFKYADIALWLGTGIIIMITLPYTTGGNHPYFTQGQYNAEPVIEGIDDLAWNRRFAVFDFKSPFTPVPYTIGVENATRFGQLWPLYGLSMLHAQAENDDERQHIKDKMNAFIKIMSDDLHEHKASVVIVPQYRAEGEEETNRTFFNFLLANADFAQAMENYKYYDTLTFDTSLATGNTDLDKIIYYDVYVLKQDNNL